MFKQARNVLLICLGITALSIIFLISSTDAFSGMSSDQRFQYAMKTIIKHEGGYSDEKLDNGGPTKYGISLRYLKSSHICIDGDCSENANEIIHLTLTEADSIYYKQWYEKFHYDKIKNENLLTDIMDFSVNAGACEAHKLAERAINDINSNNVPISCALTIKSINQINSIEPVLFHAAFQKQEEDFYYQIVKRNPSQKMFLESWLRRIGD
jgi:lysozyme family protein